MGSNPLVVHEINPPVLLFYYTYYRVFREHISFSFEYFSPFPIIGVYLEDVGHAVKLKNIQQLNKY